MPVMPRKKWDTKEQYLEYLRHLAAYVLFAKEFVAGKRILEIGCGAGYGANYLSKLASDIVAIDISREGVSHQWDRYRKRNLHFVLGNGISLPFKADSFDVVISFQVIEHIKPRFVVVFLMESRRVLKKGGIFICSTPNRKLRLLPFQKPWNPEHEKEYDRRELQILLGEAFEDVRVYGLCCASDEILAIERKRVKQNPFGVYVVGPLYRVLASHLPAPIVTLVKKIKQHFLPRRLAHSSLPQASFVNKFSLKSFRLDHGCSKDCLDLYGICVRKAELEIRNLFHSSKRWLFLVSWGVFMLFFGK